MTFFKRKNVFSWIPGLAASPRRKQIHEQELLATIEMVIDVADSDIRGVKRYRKRLRDVVSSAMDYSRALVEGLPGPVSLSLASYHADPLVKAVFVSAEQVGETVRLSMNSRSTDGGVPGDEQIALLTMERTEKTIFTREQQGEMVVGDVAKRTVNFIDHRLVAISPDLATTKEKLSNRALEVLATLAMEKILTLRSKTAELRERKVHLQSMQRIIKGRQHTIDMFAHHSHESTKKIDRIKQQLADVELELEATLGHYSGPEDALNILMKTLQSAEEGLTVQSQSFRVDWMNVLLDDREKDAGNEIALAELRAGEELQRWAMIVSFSPEGVAGN